MLRVEGPLSGKLAGSAELFYDAQGLLAGARIASPQPTGNAQAAGSNEPRTSGRRQPLHLGQAAPENSPGRWQRIWCTSPRKPSIAQLARIAGQRKKASGTSQLVDHRPVAGGRCGRRGAAAGAGEIHLAAPAEDLGCPCLYRRLSGSVRHHGRLGLCLLRKQDWAWKRWRWAGICSATACCWCGPCAPCATADGCRANRCLNCCGQYRATPVLLAPVIAAQCMQVGALRRHDACSLHRSWHWCMLACGPAWQASCCCWR